MAKSFCKGCQVHTFAHSRFTRQPNVRMYEPGTFSKAGEIFTWNLT